MSRQPISLSAYSTNHYSELSAIVQAIHLASVQIQGKVKEMVFLPDTPEYTLTNAVNRQLIKELSFFANEALIQCLSDSGHCAGIATAAKKPDTIVVDQMQLQAPYILTIDPLNDGSSTDGSIHAPFGSIFTIYKRLTPTGQPISMQDFLQGTTHIVMAGYLLYHFDMILVLASQKGVQAFSYNQRQKGFYLSHPKIVCPPECNVAYLDLARSKRNPPLDLRNVGSLVNDLHYILLQGGVFLFPSHGPLQGKLKLVYECLPMAYILKCADGRASDGQQSILDLKAEDLQQCVSFMGGSKKTLEKFEIFVTEIRKIVKENIIHGTNTLSDS